MPLPPLIRDLAVILGVAGASSWLFGRIRQPVVMGYILAGMIVGPHLLTHPLVKDLPNIHVWAELGVIFLMFSIGLEFSFRKLVKVGLSSTITAVIEISTMLALGITAGRLLGWNWIESIFLGAMISISSTTIIAKSLEELGLKTRRFSESIFAILVVEDLVAVVLIVALTGIAASQAVSGIALITTAGRMLIIMGSWIVTGYFVVPRLIRHVAKSGNDEVLAILSLGLCLLLAVFASHLGYSAVLGAFIMGSVIAESPESRRITELLRPVRDLFVAIFFVSVGMLIDPSVMHHNAGSIALIALITIAGKITANTLASLATGQSLRTSVQVGFGLAQIGEFSFIIAGLALALGAARNSIYSIAVGVSLITVLINPNLIKVSHRIAGWLEERLPARALDFLVRYGAWMEERRADTAMRLDIYRRSARWILNALISGVIFILVAEVLMPRIPPGWMNTYFRSITGMLIASALALPFVLAMFSAFSRFALGQCNDDSNNVAPGGVAVLVSRLFTVFWLAFLSAKFFPAKIAFVIALFSMAVLIAFFYKRIEASYCWFEKRFIATFDQPKHSTFRPREMIHQLTPWDAHLTRLKVHPNAPVAGKRIIDAALRSVFGINIVVIQRGQSIIVAPKAEEHLFPKDELLVLGTDEAIEKVRRHIESPSGPTDIHSDLTGYELKQIKLPDNTPLGSKSIRTAGLREHFGVTVVGIQSGEHRIINPGPDYVFQRGNILWLVGESASIDKLGEYASGLANKTTAR